MKRIYGFLLLMMLCGTVTAQEFIPWARAVGSYQFALRTDFKNDSAYDINRARIGFDGMFMNNVYFCVTIDAKNTKKGAGAELKAAFLNWHFAKYHWLDVGALTTTFTRGLSGTEYAFINYDITTNLDAYQYGIQLKGLFANGLVSYFFSMTDGEGYKKINIGSGFLFTGRIELQLLGRNKETAQDGTITYKFADLREGAVNRKDTMLTLGVAGALDNKYESPDYGLTYETFNGLHFVGDLTFRHNGLAFFAQGNMNLYGKKYNDAYWGIGGDGVARVKKSLGGFAQISFNLGKFLPFELEPIVKFEYWKDTVNEGADDRLYVKRNIAVGANLYLNGHRCKITMEYRRVLQNDFVDEMIIKPTDNFLGLQITHSFSTPKLLFK